MNEQSLNPQNHHKWMVQTIQNGVVYYLVGGFNPSEKDESQLG